MKKRIFAGLLTLVMVFTLLPVSAMAEAGNWEQNLFNGFKRAYGTVVGTKSFTAATTFQTDKAQCYDLCRSGCGRELWLKVCQ